MGKHNLNNSFYRDLIKWITKQLGIKSACSFGSIQTKISQCNYLIIEQRTINNR